MQTNYPPTPTRADRRFPVQSIRADVVALKGDMGFPTNSTRSERRRLARAEWKEFCRKHGCKRGTKKAPSLSLVAKAIETGRELVESR